MGKAIGGQCCDTAVVKLVLPNFVDVTEKKCHCRCKLGAGDTPCRDGFSDEERDSIRYVLFIFDRKVIRRDGSVEIIFLSNWRIMLLYYYTLYPLRLMCLDACVKRVSFRWHFNHHSIKFLMFDRNETKISHGILIWMCGSIVCKCYRLCPWLHPLSRKTLLKRFSGLQT